MADMNMLMFLGKISTEIKLEYLPSQVPVANFDMVTNTRRGNSEEVCFMSMSAYGKNAEAIVKHLGKGSKVLVHGRLRTERWKTATGQSMSKIRCTVEKQTFIDDARTAIAKDKSLDEPRYVSEDDIAF